MISCILKHRQNNLLSWHRSVATLCCALALPLIAQAPMKTLLVGVDHRSAMSLNGDWHYLIDQPPARGLYTLDGKVRDNGYGMNSHPNITSGPHNEEYDFKTAPTMKIPGDWNSQDPTLFHYEGVVWFQRDFEVQPKTGSRTFLHIGAANYQSYVWVNPVSYTHLRAHET